jgi:peptide/nickel transport system permease protein
VSLPIFLQAAMLFIAFAFPIVNLVIDVLYTYLDPRVRYE